MSTYNENLFNIFQLLRLSFPMRVNSTMYLKIKFLQNNCIMSQHRKPVTHSIHCSKSIPYGTPKRNNLYKFTLPTIVLQLRAKTAMLKYKRLIKFPIDPSTSVSSKTNQIKLLHILHGIDQSLLNIERGIASLMHINFENGPVSEIDVSGICNNFYNIKSSTKVNKIKTDCSHWDLKVNYRGEKPLGK